ncbi:prepilin-type N-terminal cleavage/methylation domain-containing protein [Thalassotalea euphylliae]|uniref:Prepilin-type N-terminal cleavage/methylation domain-containing protein n=1 Tax=Thalassotalea euphylliae TaxID=1655234 RepID=A0A3E0TU01_9GAMM|nr:prepilin-type N-terminal cleavage/methylation domain-containing protein [Thalassotalea euphylliae]REL28161.1 prepilin-type N-terminal cleavage/methylation domain-containing protein [Thalassotalea euphylliae]
MPSRSRGFTLIEMVMVIVLLGIVSVGIGSFIRLGSQAYAEVSARDELIASARFAVERLNRELRQALPNSIRTNFTSVNVQCVEFMPIVASTIYQDVPVRPEPASDTLSIINFSGANDIDNNHSVAVYPINQSDLYANNSSYIYSVDNVSIPANADIGTVELDVVSNIHFAEDSPTQRLYFISSPVSYCVEDTELYRYERVNNVQNRVLMAQNFQTPNNNPSDAIPDYAPFELMTASQFRNAITRAELRFSRDGEQVIFNNEVQVLNVP